MTSNPPSLFFGKKKRIVRRRAGVSPVIATTIIIAITVVLGLALWAFANAGVGTASLQYSQAVDNYGEAVNQRFVIASAEFDSGSNTVAFWIFNSGKNNVTIDSSRIFVTCRDDPTLGVCTDVGLVNPERNPHLDSSTLTKFRPNALGTPLTNYDVQPNELMKFTINTDGATSYIQNQRTYDLTVFSDNGVMQTSCCNKGV